MLSDSASLPQPVQVGTHRQAAVVSTPVSSTSALQHSRHLVRRTLDWRHPCTLAIVTSSMICCFKFHVVVSIVPKYRHINHFPSTTISALLPNTSPSAKKCAKRHWFNLFHHSESILLFHLALCGACSILNFCFTTLTSPPIQLLLLLQKCMRDGSHETR